MRFNSGFKGLMNLWHSLARRFEIQIIVPALRKRYIVFNKIRVSWLAWTYEIFSKNKPLGSLHNSPGNNSGNSKMLWKWTIKDVVEVKNKSSFSTKYSEYKLFTLYRLTVQLGAHGGAVGWGMALQAGRSRVRFSMVSMEFFIDIILPAALWPWGWLSL